MRYKQTTQVPNELFDVHLKVLTPSEMKILFIVIRQTYGWRKERDRINHTQFITKTGLSRRIVSEAIQSLSNKKLIVVSDYAGKILETAEERRGKLFLFYTASLYINADSNQNKCKESHSPVQNSEHNKTKFTKINKQNSFEDGETSKQSDSERIKQILASQDEK